MDFDREYIKALRKNVNKKRIIEKRLEKLRYDRDLLSAHLSELERIKYGEEDDVIRLEKKTLERFILSVLGQLDEALTLEKKEALEAAFSYDTCFAELEAVKDDIIKLEEERKIYFDCEVKYEKLVREKDKEIRNAKNSEALSGLLEMEEKIADCEQRIEEINAALREGNYTREILRDLLVYLEDAEGYGMTGLFAKAVATRSGSGWGASKASAFRQHKELDNVDAVTKLLCVQLRKFSEMLNEDICGVKKTEVGKGLRLLNYLYDGMGVNIYIESIIKEGQKSAKQVDTDVMLAMNALLREKEKAEELIPRLERAKKQYILNAEI